MSGKDVTYTIFSGFLSAICILLLFGLSAKYLNDFWFAISGIIVIFVGIGFFDWLFCGDCE